MWMQLVLVCLITAALLVLPGALINRLAGLRGPDVVLLAPVVSCAAIGLGAVAAGALGVAWGWAPVAVVVLVLAALAALLRRLLRRWSADSGETRPWAHAPATLLGAAIGGVLFAIDGVRMIGRPDAFSQTFDNIFHLSVVRWILDHHDASSLHMSMTTADGSGTFYPLGWHDVVSLSLRITGGQDVVLATNALILVGLVIVWPWSCLFLARRLGLTGAVAMASCGVLCAAFGAFPAMLIGFGVIYPNFLALAMLPGLIGLGLSVFRLGPATPLPVPPALIVGTLGLVGVGIVHPNVSLTMVAVVGSVLVAVWGLPTVLDRSSGWAGRRRVRLAAVLGWWVVSAALYLVIRPSFAASVWGPERRLIDAVIEAVTLSPMVSTVGVVAAGLALVGWVRSALDRRFWALGGVHLVFVFLWLVAAAKGFGRLRYLLVGPWYNDTYRLAALLPITAVLLALLAVDWLVALASRRRPLAAAGPWLKRLVAATGVALLAFTTHLSGGVNQMVDWVHDHYVLDENSPLVTADEYAVIMAVPTLVPEGEAIVVNPWNGSSLVYPLTGWRTTATHVLYDPSPDQQVINDELDEVATDPEVCRVLADLHSYWVLDFGMNQLINDSRIDYPGWDSVYRAEGFELVMRRGAASLYRVNACG